MSLNQYVKPISTTPLGKSKTIHVSPTPPTLRGLSPIGRFDKRHCENCVSSANGNGPCSKHLECVLSLIEEHLAMACVSTNNNDNRSQVRVLRSEIEKFTEGDIVWWKSLTSKKDPCHRAYEEDNLVDGRTVSPAYKALQQRIRELKQADEKRPVYIDKVLYWLEDATNNPCIGRKLVDSKGGYKK